MRLSRLPAGWLAARLLSLRDAKNPWPVELNLANGPTRVTLDGTLQDPLAFQGANVRLRFSGPDMGLLEPLVGFPIPKTPAYQIAGKLDLQGFDKIRFTDFEGRLGNSDVAGTIEEEPGASTTNGKAKPVVTMDLRSKRVDLADLNGFIGGTPGRTNTANATPEERRAVAKANASPKLLPDTPISIPRLDWADIHLRYHGAHIEGRNIPLDDLAVDLDVVGGRITLHPISFGVGKGRLIGDIDLTPTTGKDVRAKVDLRMQNLDVSRLMAATHTFQGAGSVSGVGAIDATGDSLASLMANGNGEVKMAMAGGDLSALLIDLTGLQFGNALLSALGIPTKTPVQCFVSDLDLRRGVLDFNVMTLDTGEAITNVGGDVNLRQGNHRPCAEDGRQALLCRVLADSDQHRRHVQGSHHPARRRGCRSGRRGGRSGRVVRAAGDPADDPVRHVGGRRRTLRRIAPAGAGNGRREGSAGAGKRRFVQALSVAS